MKTFSGVMTDGTSGMDMPAVSDAREVHEQRQRGGGRVHARP
jgi:hypothetical protein